MIKSYKAIGKYYFILTALIASLVQWNQASAENFEISGTVKNQNQEPLDSVYISLAMVDENSVGTSVFSDAAGSYSIISAEGIYQISAFRKGYLDLKKDVRLDRDLEDFNLIMEVDESVQSTELDEVEVIAEALKSYADRDEMYLTSYNRNFGINALDAITSLPRFIPNINASELQNNKLQIVNLLIDGRRASAQELRNLNGKDIAKVIYYDSAPAQYNGMFNGAPVANIILRRPKELTATGKIGANSALTTVETTEEASVTIMSPKTLLSADYNFGYANVADVRSSKSYSYDDLTDSFDLTKYRQEIKRNIANIGFQYDLGNNMFYAKFSYTGRDDHNNKDYRLSEITPVSTLYGTRETKNHNFRDAFDLNLYYSHNFNNGSTLMVDAVGSISKSNVRDILNQLTDEDMAFPDYTNDSYTHADMRYLIGNIAYNFNLLGGSASTSLYNSYMHLSQNYINNFFPDIPSHNVNSSNNTNFNIAYNRMFGKLSANISMAFYNTLINSTNGEKHNDFLLYPRIQLRYPVTNWLSLSMMGWTESTRYGLGQQNINRYFIDTRYFKENIEYMKQTQRWKINFSMDFNLLSNKLFISPSVTYAWHHNDYFNYIYKEDDLFISRPYLVPHQNIVSYMMSIMWMPLPGLQLRPIISGDYQAYPIPGGKERFNSVYGMLVATYGVKQWQFQIYTTTPKRNMNGIQYTKTGCKLNLSVYWRSPKFYAGLGYSYTGAESVRTEVPGFIEKIYYWSIYRRNYVSLTLGYNFKIGKYNRSSIKRKGLYNKETDTGL